MIECYSSELGKSLKEKLPTVQAKCAKINMNAGMNLFDEIYQKVTEELEQENNDENVILN